MKKYVIITIVLFAIYHDLECLLKKEQSHQNNNNNNNNYYYYYYYYFPETRKYWVDVQRGIVGNPSRDGVSIKILVWRHLKPNPQLL